MNAFNSHLCVAGVLKAGANERELHGAICIEFLPTKKLREDMTIIMEAEHRPRRARLIHKPAVGLDLDWS